MGRFWSAEVFREFGYEVGTIGSLLFFFLAVQHSVEQLVTSAFPTSAALASHLVGLFTAGRFTTTFRSPFSHQVASGVVDSGLLGCRVS